MAIVKPVQLGEFKVGDRVTPKHRPGSRHGVIEGFRKNKKTPVVVRWMDDDESSTGYWGLEALVLDDEEIIPGNTITTSAGTATVVSSQGEVIFAKYGDGGISQPHVIDGIQSIATGTSTDGESNSFSVNGTPDRQADDGNDCHGNQRQHSNNAAVSVSPASPGAGDTNGQKESTLLVRSAAPNLKCYWVILFESRTHPYQLPKFKRVAVIRETPHTIRVVDDNDQQWNEPKHTAWCLPWQKNWSEFLSAYTDYQKALDELAAQVRQMRRYDQLLKANPKGKNPLASNVVEIADPDRHYNWDRKKELWDPPTAVHLEVERHTPAMLRTLKEGRLWAATHQYLYFACDDKACREAIDSLIEQAQQCAECLANYVLGLGTYSRSSEQGENWNDDEDESDESIIRALPELAGDIEPVWAEHIPDDPDLDWLAIQINLKHSSGEKNLAQALYDARDAGRLLVEARAKIKQLKQRNWLEWLEQNFDGSRRSAYNYMAIAEGWEERISPNLQPDANLGANFGIRGALALLKDAEDLEKAESDDIQLENQAAVPAQSGYQSPHGQNINDEPYIQPSPASRDKSMTVALEIRRLCQN